MPPERAVARLTREPADWLGIDAGRLEEGAPADVVVLRAPRDLATHERPDRYPHGIEQVLVEGEVALDCEGVTARARGRLLTA